MDTQTKTKPNIKQAVPFFMVSDMDASLRYYVDDLGFEMINKWIPRDKIEWCYLRRGGADLMLQEFHREGHDAHVPVEKRGSGVTICFMCEDALELYDEFTSRGIKTSEPFVGNAMWVTSLLDPDGYKLDFESDTDTPEGTRLAEFKKRNDQ